MQAIGLPTIGVPAIVALLIVCQSPPSDGVGATTAPTAATSYPMPELNPAGRPVGYTGASGSGAEVPTGALATAAADPGTTPDLVTLTAAERQIPAPVLTAYQQAAAILTAEQPGCQLRWQLLAGIGKVESGNAQGRQISADGTVTPTILGPRLTGTGGFARILDTDRGALDDDTVYDRAVGPLQFLPGTWKGAGRDANADGRKDPNNIHDAALAAGGYLCAHGRDLTNPAQLNAAIRAYNPSDAYVRAVLAWATGYGATGPEPVLVTPGTPPATGDAGQPVPPVALAPALTTSGTAAMPGACAPISLTTGSLGAVLTATTLDLTGRYTAVEPADGVLTIHTTVRSTAGQALAQSDRAVPLRPGEPPVLLSQLPLSGLTAPGQTSSVSLTLAVSPPGCPTSTLAALTVTNVSRPPTTSPSPSATKTPAGTPAAAPTPSPSEASSPATGPSPITMASPAATSLALASPSATSPRPSAPPTADRTP